MKHKQVSKKIFHNIFFKILSKVMALLKNLLGCLKCLRDICCCFGKVLQFLSFGVLHDLLFDVLNNTSFDVIVLLVIDFIEDGKIFKLECLFAIGPFNVGVLSIFFHPSDVGKVLPVVICAKI